MFLVSRRQREVLLIGEDIRITVVKIKGRQVRIGIEAPKTIAVSRPDAQMRPSGESREPESERFPTD